MSIIELIFTTIVAVIGFVGTVTGIIFGYRGYKEQSKTKIFYFRKQFIQLHDDIVKGIPGLEITYNNKKIEKKMFVVKAAFICSGTKDITSSDIDKGLILDVHGENAQWHKYQIPKQSPNLELDIDDSNPAKLIITPKLFKDGDYFVFDALGESENAGFTMDHRIAHVRKKIIKKNLGEASLKIFKALPYLVFSLIFFWVYSEALSTSTKIYSFKAAYFDRNNQEIEESKVIDTVSFYEYKDWLRRKNPLYPDSIATLKKYPKSMDPRLRKLLMSIDSLSINNDSVVTVKEPRTEDGWKRNDSISNVADSEYSKSKLKFIFEGKTKRYRLSPNYTVEYILNRSVSDLITLLVLPLLFAIITLIVAIVKVAQYFRYKGIEKRAEIILS